jgi:hypothetical protein
MAYAAVVTYPLAPDVQFIQYRRHLLVQIAETEGAAASEYEIPLAEFFPSGIWKIVRIKVVKSAGTEATVAPVFGTAANPTAGTIAYVGGLVAAGSQDSTNSGAGWVGTGSKLYVRTVPNAGADNTNTTQILLIDGWN